MLKITRQKLYVREEKWKSIAVTTTRESRSQVKLANSPIKCGRRIGAGDRSLRDQLRRVATNFHRVPHKSLLFVAPLSVPTT